MNKLPQFSSFTSSSLHPQRLPEGLARGMLGVVISCLRGIVIGMGGMYGGGGGVASIIQDVGRRIGTLHIHMMIFILFVGFIFVNVI